MPRYQLATRTSYQATEQHTGLSPLKIVALVDENMQLMIIGCLSHCSRTSPGQCRYGHSLAPGMPQKISWMPCICEPARESERQGREMGHLTLWCGTCSAEDHLDTRFYEPPHQVSYSGPVSGWMTQPDALARRR